MHEWIQEALKKQPRQIYIKSFENGEQIVYNPITNVFHSAQEFNRSKIWGAYDENGNVIIIGVNGNREWNENMGQRNK